eukprot:TRINITY_DN5292_c0_g1_i1.p2 TRINITY_DN5292_c0_g1~~TRINITY_DN5292_c0_g1_i1.p2  ORF type:complete len:372 (-),score=90.09 TRINITY_DN5292_c0_g1_i1:98-1213(-)
MKAIVALVLGLAVAAQAAFTTDELRTMMQSYIALLKAGSIDTITSNYYTVSTVYFWDGPTSMSISGKHVGTSGPKTVYDYFTARISSFTVTDVKYPIAEDPYIVVVYNETGTVKTTNAAYRMQYTALYNWTSSGKLASVQIISGDSYSLAQLMTCDSTFVCSSAAGRKFSLPEPTLTAEPTSIKEGRDLIPARTRMQQYLQAMASLYPPSMLVFYETSSTIVFHGNPELALTGTYSGLTGSKSLLVLYQAMAGMMNFSMYNLAIIACEGRMCVVTYDEVAVGFATREKTNLHPIDVYTWSSTSDYLALMEEYSDSYALMDISQCGVGYKCKTTYTSGVSSGNADSEPGAASAVSVGLLLPAVLALALLVQW